MSGAQGVLTPQARPAVVWVLAVLLTFIGVGAIISGAMLAVVPDGHLMKWTTSQLAGTPFRDYLIPGMILLLFVGVFPLFVAYGLLKAPAWKWPDALNPAKKAHWAWAASWAAGVVMLIWIAVETALLGYVSFLQPVVGVYGIAIIVLTMLPGARRWCAR